MAYPIIMNPYEYVLRHINFPSLFDGMNRDASLI